jgi:hypothetical protein
MTLTDAQQAIIVAGLNSGFRVMREYPVVFWDTLKYGLVDVAWFRGESRIPHVLFEIEGVNVPLASLEGDLRKFRWGGARHNVIFLYTHRNGNPLVSADLEAADLVHDRLVALTSEQPVPELLLPNAFAAEELLITRVQEEWGDA